MPYNRIVGAYILCAPIAFPSLPPVALAPWRRYSNGAIICHSCPHEDGVARPVGKAETPRDTREDRVYAATVCMRAGLYQKGESYVSFALLRFWL